MKQILTPATEVVLRVARLRAARLKQPVIALNYVTSPRGFQYYYEEEDDGSCTLFWGNPAQPVLFRFNSESAMKAAVASL